MIKFLFYFYVHQTSIILDNNMTAIQEKEHSLTLDRSLTKCNTFCLMYANFVDNIGLYRCFITCLMMTVDHIRKVAKLINQMQNGTTLNRISIEN